MESIPSFPPLKDLKFGELKKRGLKGYLTPSNSLKSSSIPFKKTLKQVSLNLSPPIPSTPPYSLDPKIALVYNKAQSKNMLFYFYCLKSEGRAYNPNYFASPFHPP